MPATYTHVPRIPGSSLQGFEDSQRLSEQEVEVRELRFFLAARKLVWM